MANVALLIGNTRYQTLPPLDCCKDDVCAIKELLEATSKFDHISVLIDADSTTIKDTIRAAIDAHAPLHELFFYFTGHGFQYEGEFFFCSTDFTAKRPNVTGLSNTELHALLRPADTEVVVKVIDACYSGALLIKADGEFLPVVKNEGFKNLIQIASCLDSQNSLTGNPLSLFTDHFRSATLEKRDGPIYYSDIIAALRDSALDNNAQTPHFVFQGTAREKFVEDAKVFDELRTKLSRHADEAQNLPSVAEQPAGVRSILERAENKFANKAAADAFIARLFDQLRDKISPPSIFSELFNAEIIEHSDFQELTTRAFVIRVLLNEKRPDNFVIARLKEEHKQRNPFNIFGAITERMAMMEPMDEHATKYDLTLNCSLDKCQLKITLRPKFVALKSFVLVVSCVPSLERCYVMEMLTQHPLKDWGEFDFEGSEITRRWYKMEWTDSCASLVEKIFDKVRTTVQESVDVTAQALSQK